jgi:ribosomal protein L37E
MGVSDAIRFKRDYVCAHCFGEIFFPINSKTATCSKCGDGAGFVTRTYANRKKDESFYEFHEARSNLRGLMEGLEIDQKRKDENMKIFSGG